MKLWVNTATFYREQRLEGLNKFIDSIFDLPIEDKKLIISCNINFPSNKAEVVEVKDLHRNFDLTWEHKKYIPEFLKSDFTHFIYSEDDQIITPELLSYWTKYREILKPYGFIPGIHRIEYKDGKAYSVDNRFKQRYKEVVIEGERFASLDEPYQGIMILDREMAEQHINSPSYKYNTCRKIFGYEESANSDYIYDDKPKGFNHRVLVPIQNFKDCWIHHYTNNFSVLTGTLHGKLPAEDVV